MIGTIKENISYKYRFTAEERAENAQNLAHAQIQKVELEDEKKALTSEYKAKIDAQTSLVNLISRHVIDGYTTKTKYALKRKNFADKIWEWVDEDTNEILKTEKLTGKDLNFDIPFPEAEKKPERAFDEETGEVFNQPPTPPLPPIESFLGADRPAMPAFDAVVTPEVEDLDNGSEAVTTDDGLGYFRTLPNAEARELPEGKADDPTEPEEDSDDDEGTGFDADTYNPDDEETKPEPPRRGPGRPRKS